MTNKITNVLHYEKDMFITLFTLLDTLSLFKHNTRRDGTKKIKNLYFAKINLQNFASMLPLEVEYFILFKCDHY